jgi:outer membrane lipoprotein SlyB
MKKLSMLAAAFLVPTLVMGQGKIIQYNKDPVVDVPKGEEARYKQDLQECRDLAVTAEGNKKAGVKTGRRIGVIAGAAGGALTGEGAVKGAAVGGAAGGISGRTAGAMQDSNDAGFVVRKCLTGRGWTVLDYDGQK